VSGVFAGSLAKKTKHAFVGAPISSQVYLDCGGGEVESTFRLLCHRKQVSRTITTASTDIAFVGGFTYRIPIPDPVIWPRYASGVQPTVPSIMMSLYVAWRGAVRNTVEVCSYSQGTYTAAGNAWDATTQMVAVRRPRNQQQNGSAIMSSAVFSNGYGNNAQAFDFYDSGVEITTGANAAPDPISYEIPFAFPNPIVQSTYTGDEYYNSCVLFRGFRVTSTYLYFRLMQAFGDDIQFFGWTGMPTLLSGSGYSQTGWTAW